MCGIVGAVAQRNVIPALLEGLKRLEYRGYDSCGIAVYQQDALHRVRSTDRVAELAAQVHEQQLQADTGIAHTRWATHGAPATHNAHPHFSGHESGASRIALVHNGIIENHDVLRDELRNIGYVFESQTDTEVVAHLIDHLYQGDLLAAVQQACLRLQGAYALAVIASNEPHRMVGARNGSPLVAGLGEGENFLASDALALAGETSQIIYLEDGDVVDLKIEHVHIFDASGAQVERAIHTVHLQSGEADLGPYRHYMQKEIFEQPRAVGDTLQDVEAITPELFGDNASQTFEQIDRVLILACGTSYYAGLTAKYWIESIARIPVSVEIASEYRYRDSVPNADTLVVTISQSGETADTLSALKHARSLGMENTLTICNVATSAMVRECKLAYITRAGVEIGVASTKAFTTQLTALFLLALAIAQVKNQLPAEKEAVYLKSLRHLPKAIASVLALEPQVIDWAERFSSKEHALFLGRGMHYPIALEGALKLKEISYIHAEGYPAGELKHGPLALVTEAMPVVTIAPRDELLEKLKSNMEEVHARGGELYVFADADTNIASSTNIHVIRMPENYGMLSPILHAVILQLLAYHTACALGTDVDKPRNLAKSVTVE
ncbi:glutamine--fructose-6-phosphate transaminase (isomerizing) [Paenalcaligenes niemegkensis]|uniref:glutamine--fructose-6-phosphate transaminase (isomerizing) n=1 Tax=Paenalcaligenes niemegkensis TaxID=2895469 RepID=UPI001EE97972|nr:glutamine--fructose-6-phosphate transaminase (isomerizing) [Paenalcaligenes niemegkensis]MCQ9617714.1 glutamine--fructose-6-phosphate transaminase (isomerizing) [Paenalcaligenes niemegkensis]